MIKNLRIAQGQKFNLSPLQIQLLLYLEEKDALSTTLTELSDYFQLTKATLSDSLKNLTLKHYIYKEVNPKDRRNDFVKLTNEGKKNLAEIKDYLLPIVNSLVSIDEENKEILFNLLTQIIYTLYLTGNIKVQRMCYICRYYQTEKARNLPYCNLLEKALKIEDIRLECPDFEERKMLEKDLN